MENRAFDYSIDQETIECDSVQQITCKQNDLETEISFNSNIPARNLKDHVKNSCNTEVFVQSTEIQLEECDFNEHSKNDIIYNPSELVTFELIFY